MSKYTDSELEFLINNYNLYGAPYCATYLKRNTSAIHAKAHRLGIHRDNTNKHPICQKINPTQFTTINSREVVYFLGLMWADGNITYHKGSNNIEQHKISLEMVSSDFTQIKHIIEKIGDWSIINRKRNDRWKETTTVSTNSKDLYYILHDYDYHLKSKKEPTKILKNIPNELHVYFWKGFFDGDGSISFQGKNKHRVRIKFSGRYDYNWSELLELFNSLSIENFGKYQCIGKNGNRSSCVMIQNQKECEVLCQYLASISFGLIRKNRKIAEYLSVIS